MLSSSPARSSTAAVSSVGAKRASPSSNAGRRFVATTTWRRCHVLAGASSSARPSTRGSSAAAAAPKADAAATSASARGSARCTYNGKSAGGAPGPNFARSSRSVPGGGGGAMRCGTALTPTTARPTTDSAPSSPKPPCAARSRTLLTTSVAASPCFCAATSTSSAPGKRATTSKVGRGRDTGRADRRLGPAKAHASSPKSTATSTAARRLSLDPPPTRGAGTVVGPCMSELSTLPRRLDVADGARGGMTAPTLGFAAAGTRGVGSGTATFFFAGSFGCGRCILVAPAAAAERTTSYWRCPGTPATCRARARRRRRGWSSRARPRRRAVDDGRRRGCAPARAAAAAGAFAQRHGQPVLRHGYWTAMGRLALVLSLAAQSPAFVGRSRTAATRTRL